MSSGDPGTREKILHAARTLIEERPGGYVRLSDIGRLAGVSRQAVYLHFSSRAQLLQELADWIDESERVAELLQWAIDAATPAEVLDRITVVHATHRPKVSAVASALDRAILENEDVAHVWRQRLEERGKLAARAIQRASEAGALSPDWTEAEAADFVASLTSFRTWKELTGDYKWSAERYQRTMSRALRETLLIPKARALPGESAGDVG